MSSLVSSATPAERASDFSAYFQPALGSGSSYAIIPKRTSLREKRFDRTSKVAGLRYTLRPGLRTSPLYLEIMAKRLLSSPVDINLEKLIDPLSKMPKEFKEQINALNSIKNNAAPIALVLEGSDNKLNLIEDRFLIASLADIYIIAIRILNRPIKELIREVSQIGNKNIKLLLINTILGFCWKKKTTNKGR
jgi:hypothetical protein